VPPSYLDGWAARSYSALESARGLLAVGHRASPTAALRATCPCIAGRTPS